MVGMYLSIAGLNELALMCECLGSHGRLMYLFVGLCLVGSIGIEVL